MPLRLLRRLDRFRSLRGDSGASVVEFIGVAILLIFLLMAILQVAIYLHLRNVAVASAAMGARYAANADVPTSRGDERAQELLKHGAGADTAEHVHCEAVDGVNGDDLAVVSVNCSGQIPVFFIPLGRGLLPLDISARAVAEGDS